VTFEGYRRWVRRRCRPGALVHGAADGPASTRGAPFDSVEPGVERRMCDVDALHGRHHCNLLVAQLVSGRLKRGDLVADRVEAFQLFVHGVEPFHDGGEHGVGGRVRT
jgi:hypothetical protein